MDAVGVEVFSVSGNVYWGCDWEILLKCGLDGRNRSAGL